MVRARCRDLESSCVHALCASVSGRVLASEASSLGSWNVEAESWALWQQSSLPVTLVVLSYSQVGHRVAS